MTAYLTATWWCYKQLYRLVRAAVAEVQAWRAAKVELP